MSEKSLEISFFSECWTRFKSPWCTSFFSYFFFIIVILSGAGVLFSIFSSFEVETRVLSIASNMSTYFIALIIPATIDILLSFGKLKNKVSFVIYCVVILGICGILLWLSNTINNYFALIPAIFGALLSWFFWIIANSDNENLSDYSYDRKIKDEVEKKHGGNWDEK